MNQKSAAIKTYQECIKYYPAESYVYLNLINALQEFGDIQGAIAVATSAIQVLPNNLAIKIEKQRLLPIIYTTPEEIDFFRNRFSQQLEELIEQTSLETPEATTRALAGISLKTNFYLHYQGRNDLDLQVKYGQFVHRIMTAHYPQWIKPLTIPPLSKHQKIRVGYISACMYIHTVSRIFLGWLKNHDREKLEVYCYHVVHQSDSITEQFKIYSDHFSHIPAFRQSPVFLHIPNDYTPENLEAVCKQIITDNLHVLVFIDVGMHPVITQMAALRLAPIQCLTWGHPITSGLPTIDYFLSNALMEPEDANKHYAEKLICLPNLGINYAKPVLNQTTSKRSDLQLRDDSIVYLCCQSIYKYLPQYDYIFAAIAQGVPQAQFVFVASHNIRDSIMEQFHQRLQKAFARFNLNSQKYCFILPRLDYIKYTNLLLVSDIFLDTFCFSGCMTTLEAIACNLPVVTCPGEFMRGRQSYGILKRLRVTETIAKDEAEYIEIATRLGSDEKWRKNVVEQIIHNQERLYDDKACVQALESFYTSVVQQGQ
ncbi:MAG: hypothetical protein NVS2B14_07630 [Chamaesiphon sp.]